MPVALPQEVWWLVCQEFAPQGLTGRRDFESLFNCALASRGLAHIALPLLYSIHEQSPASRDQSGGSGLARWTGLWRSIILSSRGLTMFPYCLWMKALELGNLHSLLEDIVRPHFRHLQNVFFSAPLDGLLALRMKGVRPRRGLLRGPDLDFDRIVVMVADGITNFIKDAANEESKSVTLSSLEGYHLPTDNLITWVSNLSLLTSLTIRDGSVLNEKVATAIRQSCPLFKEVVCHYVRGTDVDQDMASFVSSLAPSTLTTFKVISMNDLGQDTLTALTNHAASLRHLELMSLERSALLSLQKLRPCTNLRALTLEAVSNARSFRWEVDNKAGLPEVIAWIKDCKGLHRIRMDYVPGAGAILAEALKAPEIQLTTLEVRLLETSEAFYTSIGLQTELETLMIRTSEETTDDALAKHAALVASVCLCTKLSDLDLMDEPLSLEDLHKVSLCLPRITDLSFDGEFVDDDFLIPLSQMRNLNTTHINAMASFTFSGLFNFINTIHSDTGASHRGFHLDVLNQAAEAKISDEEEQMLIGELQAKMDGRFDLQYFRDPEDLQESDFSD